MYSKRRGILVAAVVAGSIGAPSAALLADTLVLRNGKEVAGEIERIDGGYRVKTATGYVNVTRSDVAEWRRDSVPATATRPAAPAPVKPGTATPAVPPAGAAPPALPGKPPGAPVATADMARRTAEVLVLQGTDAMALGDYKAARDCFVDAIQVDPRNRDALASVGYCYVKLDDIPRATRSLEAALASSAQPERTLALNLAYTLFRGRNQMRGAKVIKDYLASQPTAIDEKALNAFAICLGQSSEEARLSRFWTECVGFYDQYNARVEATRPGYKRWGVEWLPEAEWAITDGKNREVQTQMDAKWRDLQSARSEFAKVKKQYEEAYSASRFRKTGPSAASIEPRLRTAKANAEKLQGEYAELSAKLIRPTLPAAFEPVPVETASAGMLASTGDAGSPTRLGSPGLRADPPSQSRTPPTLVQPQPEPVVPPVAVTPPAPAAPLPGAAPSPAAPAPSTPAPATPAPERKRAIFTYACGFAVGPDLIVTSSAGVAGATRVSVQPMDSDPIDAEVIKIDEATGLALLRIKGQRVSYLPIGDGFAGGALQCVSYPTPSMFDPEAELIGGSSVPPTDGWLIRLNKHPRLAGAPVLADGKVVGVALASRDNDISAVPTAGLGQLKQLVGTLPPAAANADPMRAVVMVNGVREQ